MMKFVDGPAAAAIGLLLRRAPLFLRVVQKPDGSWDALDQLNDIPEGNEKIYAYALIDRLGAMFLDWSGPGGRRCGARFVNATYRVVLPQPDEATLRVNAFWRRWCVGMAASQNPKAPKETTDDGRTRTQAPAPADRA